MTSTYRREIAEAAASHGLDPRVVEAVVILTIVLADPAARRAGAAATAPASR